jgi:hypothetical protein
MLLDIALKQNIAVHVNINKNNQTFKNNNKTVLYYDENSCIYPSKETFNKASIPIKEYSNKFLRDLKKHDKIADEIIKSQAPNQRLSSFMKKNKKVHYRKLNRF